MLATIVTVDPKVFFAIAITPRIGERATPFPGLIHFTFDMYLIIVSVKQGDIKCHFLSLWFERPRSPGPLVNTLHTRRWAGATDIPVYFLSLLLINNTRVCMLVCFVFFIFFTKNHCTI